MKKVKLRKKYIQNKWKIKKFNVDNKKTKYFFIKFKLLYIIVILVIIIELFLKNEKYPKKKKKTENYNFNISSEEMYYKGEKILKSKLINDFLSNISDDQIKEKINERNKFNNYYYMPEYSDDPNIQVKQREKVYEIISNKTNKKINKIDKIFLSRANPFGNNVICVNNAIFYCEVLGCNQIILKENTKRKWLIKNPIHIKKLNITIEQGPDVDCNDNHTLCAYNVWDILYPFILKPKVMTQYIKEEILKNLPEVNIDPDDLYIYLRTGDIFSYCVVPSYAQPPLCFYEKIINNHKFKNIYIIAYDKRHVVFEPLIKKYPKIIYHKNSLEYDIYLLTHCYNIALATSSLAISSIKFNDNLKNVFEYDILRLYDKFIFLHHHVYKFDINYKIYSMKPSENYRSKMFFWTNSKEQRNLMLEDDCKYDFTIIKNN